METLTKICTKCKTEKPLTDFELRKDTNKYRNQCKKCLLEKRKKYRENNKEKIALRKKIYYEKNKECILLKQKEVMKDDEHREYKKKYAKEYYKKNKEPVREKQRLHRIKNIEKYKEREKRNTILFKDYIKDRSKAYYIKNKEKIIEKIKEYSQTEKGKIIRRNMNQRRRLLVKDGDVTTNQLQELISKSTHCYWCKTKLKNEYQIDHYFPISKGGKHTISNLVITCPTCNLKKNAKDPIEFAQERGRLF